MGLLTDEGSASDIAEVKSVFEGISHYWHKKFEPKWGFSVMHGNKSIERICHFSNEYLFTGHAMPRSPGPFKRAAAFAILSRLFVDTRFQVAQGMDHLAASEVDKWRSRLAFLSIPIVLQKTVVTNGQTPRRLDKPWMPATIHLSAEIHNWLRWLEKPFIHLSSHEQLHSEGKDKWDVARLCRSVMVFAMVIEQSYYISGNRLKCDMMHDHECTQAILRDPEAGEDIWWNLRSADSAYPPKFV